jgi:hypothetical protein
MTQEQLAKGCVCLATIGTKKFPVYLTAGCVKPWDSQTNTQQFGLSLSSKLFEILHLNPKEAKEVILDDLTGQGPKNQNINITGNALTDLVISIKDRYVSKRELWKFQIRLLGSVVYKSLPPPNEELLRCSSAVVEDIGPGSFAGIVGPQTRIVIRTNSAQICLIVNIAKELWDFDCVTREPLFRKTVQLVREGIEACHRDSQHHHLMLILCMRPDNGSPDVYETVFEGPISNLDAKNFEKKMINFFNFFPTKIGWLENAFYKEGLGDDDQAPGWLLPTAPMPSVSIVRDSAVCACTHEEEKSSTGFPSSAAASCVLESINLAISHFGKHHMDRKLGVTGTQITVITPNNGLFVVEDQNLFCVTQRRVQATACGIRVVSVGRKPVVPNLKPVCEILSTKTTHTIDWLVFYNFSGKSPILRDTDGLDFLANLLLPNEPSAFHETAFQYRPPALCSEFTANAKKIVPEPFKASVPRIPARTDEEIVHVAIAQPRLQRVAVEATIRASDMKPIDNWIVQGEGVKTLHDLIGTRLSLDMQMVDISGTETLTPPVMAPTTGGSLSPRSEKAPSSSMISANAFGVKVHRSSMREFHIQKVLLRGGEDRCLWMLNRLDSGNVYVSRVALANQRTSDSETIADGASCVYKYVFRKSQPSSQQTDVSEVIACKSCLAISDTTSIQIRRFFIPPPIPWNVLDEIISNPYFQRTLPSSIPLNQAPVPPELEGFRWKLRSSIRTGLFCLIPRDEGFSHFCPSNSAGMLGSDIPILAPNVSSSTVASRFLDWLRKTETLFNIGSLNITVLGDKSKRSSRAGTVPHLIQAENANEWFHFHADPVFQFPKLFAFSLEWILCHSAIIDQVVQRLEQFAQEDSFMLVRLPHAQLFPLPAPGGEADVVDPLPFHPRTVIKLPEWTKASFFGLLVSRLMDQLGMLLLFRNREPGSPEGFFVGPGRGTIYFSRQVGWMLVNKAGTVLVEISNSSVDWIENCTNSWTAGRPAVDSKLFLLFKQCVHTSLIDSQRQD